MASPDAPFICSPHNTLRISGRELVSPWGVKYNEWILSNGPEVIPFAGDTLNNWHHVPAAIHPDSTGYSLPAALLSDVEDHEEGPQGHHGRLVAEFATVNTCGNANTLLERLAGDAPIITPLAVEDVLTESRFSVFYAKSHYFVFGDVGPRVFTQPHAPWDLDYRNYDAPSQDTGEVWDGDQTLCNQPQ